MKLVITNHIGTISNNFFLIPAIAKQSRFVIGLTINTANRYPKIMITETEALSVIKLFHLKITVSKKQRLQIKATLDKNKSQRINKITSIVRFI